MNRILHPTLLRLKTLAGNPEGDVRLSQWRAQLEVPGTVKAAEAP